MKNFAIYIGILVALCTLVQSGPMARSVDRPTKEALQPKDWFEDVIRATIGMSVRELLQLTQATFNELNAVTETGLRKLEEVYANASPAVKNELIEIENRVTEKIFEIVEKLLLDLGKVLPNLSMTPTSSEEDDDENPISQYSAADIILAILGITLENFVTIIARTFEGCANLLTDTMVDFQRLEAIANSEVALGLRDISENYLMTGKSVVMPVLDTLHKVI